MGDTKPINDYSNPIKRIGLFIYEHLEHRLFGYPSEYTLTCAEGNFVLEELIGSGSEADVYAAHETAQENPEEHATENPCHRYSIKIYRETNKTAEKRAERNVARIAKLKHNSMLNRF